MSGAGRLRFQVGEAIAEHALWAAGDRVAVAVSGGLDSVCLLDLLQETAGWHGAVLEVVTVDHGTRAGSGEDAGFVERLAAERDLPCTRIDLALGAGASEATCRAARFDALDALPVDAVALAHHLDDQAETVLVNLLRGTSPAGLQGIAWRRGRYVRPLLGTSRADLRDWAAWRGLAWREDPTNASDRFLRNRLRAEVLPLLESVRTGAGAALARSATLAAEQGALLDAWLDADPEATPGADGWATAWMADTPPALVRRALHRHLAPITTSQVDAVLSAARRGGGRVDLGDRVVTVGGDRVRVEPLDPT